jgi:hypothetical protein
MRFEFIDALIDDELRALCVPLDQCVSVKTGKVDRSVLVELEARALDQAPVYDADQRNVLGLISTKRLRELFESGIEIDGHDPEVHNEGHFLYTGPFLTLETLLSTLSERRAVFVVRESSVTEYGYTATNYGLLTISDLNRHPLRSALYTLFSLLESGLASMIQESFSDSWEWIRTLNENHQVGILGYWELSRRKGVDVGPIAAATLSQLIQIVSRNRALLTTLGFNSRSEFEKVTAHIPETRNWVMHPVRPLIFDTADVATLRETVGSVCRLHKTVDHIRNTKPAN